MSKTKHKQKPKSKKKKDVSILKKKTKPVKTEKLDPRIEEVREEWVEYVCPIRGKVKQKVKIYKYKSLSKQAERHILPTNTIDERLEKIDNGLSIYSSEEKEEKEE